MGEIPLDTDERRRGDRGRGPGRIRRAVSNVLGGRLGRGGRRTARRRRGRAARRARSAARAAR